MELQVWAAALTLVVGIVTVFLLTIRAKLPLLGKRVVPANPIVSLTFSPGPVIRQDFAPLLSVNQLEAALNGVTPELLLETSLKVSAKLKPGVHEFALQKGANTSRVQARIAEGCACSLSASVGCTDGEQRGDMAGPVAVQSLAATFAPPLRVRNIGGLLLQVRFTSLCNGRKLSLAIQCPQCRMRMLRRCSSSASSVRCVWAQLPRASCLGCYSRHWRRWSASSS